MPNYIKRPQFDKLIKRVNRKETKSEINADILAEAIAKAMEMFNTNCQNTNKDCWKPSNIKETENDEFDNSKTLSKIADRMTIVESKESNIKDLGNTKSTKKDNKETDKTINLLSNLKD